MRLDIYEYLSTKYKSTLFQLNLIESLGALCPGGAYTRSPTAMHA